ncbi:MAG: ABC transporter ATP-binding protein [Elusimicrobia bacterium]|nr:ABC transporter ATP-binding protein [Elusimicrobiota bacterium]
MATIKMASVCFSCGRARLLSDASLVFRSGELTAIIGPSGSGKSTLIKCLTTTHRPTSGAVTVGGKDIWKDKRAYRLALGYVPQDDIIHPQLTVEQAFTYAGRLRLDTGMDDEALDKRIKTIASLLSLSEAMNRRIFRLSGGQRKRGNIGVELLADPDIIILDEPASGLDPGTEEDLVKLLASLARLGRTVVMTIHSMEHLGMADKIVMVASGRVIFCGTRPELLAHFQVPHPAEVFKVVRSKDIESWVNRYRSSALAGRAAGD